MMDPTLQDATCVCPNMHCQDGMVPAEEVEIWEECPRCDGTGYILCDQLWPGERTFTMAQQRAGIRVVAEGSDHDTEGT